VGTTVEDKKSNKKSSAGSGKIKWGLRPEELAKAGILRDTASIDGALKRAERLIQQGDYREAKSLLMPHRCASDNLKRARVMELCAMCGIRSGGTWENALETAHTIYTQNQNLAGLARVQGHLGRASVCEGKFKEANIHYTKAAQLWKNAGQLHESLAVEGLRGEVLLEVAQPHKALVVIDRCLAGLWQMGHLGRASLLQIDRARILTHLGEKKAAAVDLMAAERYLASTGDRSHRIKTRLVRAEMLILEGDLERAGDGLKKLLQDVVSLEDIRVTAWVHVLQGQAKRLHAPTRARRHFMRAKHLYRSIRAAYGVARCDIALARIESKLGLAGHGRFKSLKQVSGQTWPLLVAQLKIARAEHLAPEAPQRAREILMKLRDFAAQVGLSSLVHATESTLDECQLSGRHSLSPIRFEKTAFTSVNTLQTSPGYVPAGGLQRLEEHTANDGSLTQQRRLRNSRQASKNAA
jgi:tetratricopeptide (TPR) repeat protein